MDPDETAHLEPSHLDLKCLQMQLVVFGALRVNSLPAGGRTGLVVRALDSGSGDPGSILGRVGVLFP